VLDAVKPGQLVCDLGTSGIDTVKRLERVLAEREVRFVDAPVSGSVPTVQAGRLLVMAGGSAQDVADVTPVLAPVAANVIHVGEVGAGQAMKLAVNLIVYATNAAISEALVLAETAGIHREVAYDVLQNSVVSSPFLTYKRAAFLDDSEPVAMSLALVNKDLGLILALARELEVSQPVTAAVAQRVTAACTEGYAAHDMASLRRFSPRSPA
jgi:3-hydroxyisobutyrate dehydrogenase-like beta-hydroxyacid dehydrogenase